MNSLFLNNYNLSPCEAVQSLILSEYGLRHLNQAGTQDRYQCYHLGMAVVELIPVIGLIVTIFEAIIVEFIIPLCLSAENVDPSPSLSQHWVFIGNQAGCKGHVSVKRAKIIRRCLQREAPEGIRFNKEKIKDTLEGGTCSSMSFELIHSYFKTKKICQHHPDYNGQMLIDRMSEIGKEFKTSSQKMKNRQAAFNTIEVIPNLNKVDYSRNKVQALANYHDLAIKYSSAEIDLKDLNTAEDLEPLLNTLPEGVYFIRNIEKENNEKLENSGHSLVYIIEEGISLFYDPNKGLKNFSELDHSKELLEQFKNDFGRWKLHSIRFHRVEPA